MLPTCVDCGAGKYSGADEATAATLCVDCGAGTYVNVTGSTTCLECSWEHVFFGSLHIFSGTPETNKLCEVYVHDVPGSVKIVIACEPTLLVLLLFCDVWMCSRLERNVSGEH